MRYPSGFVPVNFQLVGKVLLVLGIAALLTKGLDYLTGWLALPNEVSVFGVALVLVSLYLIFVVPKLQ